jgi:hypothetical protein
MAAVYSDRDDEGRTGPSADADTSPYNSISLPSGSVM